MRVVTALLETMSPNQHQQVDKVHGDGAGNLG
jgi:hypothetical protein